MIRVNLMAGERPTQKKKASASSSSMPSAPGSLQLYLFLALFVGGAIALAAGWFVVLDRQIAALNADIEVKKKRQAELQTIKKQVDEFQAKKKMLEDKVALIERLRAEQSGPVHMIDEISKALPDFVWLTSLDQTGGSVKFVGETTGLTSVADFISNLQRSGWFPTVDLTESKENNGIVTFTLTAQFKDPQIAAREKEAAAKRAAEAAANPPARPTPKR